jgi:SNF2 family DNA or RNA helicase
MRAQALVKINALRKLAGTGKIPVAAEWIDDFLASGEKLIVFAEHRDVQNALLDRFPDAAHLLGSDTQDQRQAAVDRFQRDPDVLLCICSLKVAAHGITLTAAANVAFVELGWTPAEHDQAEDRCHRIGQHDAVTAWYLLAAGTIDDRISALIDHKRLAIGAITDGAAPADAAMLDALLLGYIQADRHT